MVARCRGGEDSTKTACCLPSMTDFDSSNSSLVHGCSQVRVENDSVISKARHQIPIPVPRSHLYNSDSSLAGHSVSPPTLLPRLSLTGNDKQHRAPARVPLSNVETCIGVEKQIQSPLTILRDDVRAMCVDLDLNSSDSTSLSCRKTSLNEAVGSRTSVCSPLVVRLVLSHVKYTN